MFIALVLNACTSLRGAEQTLLLISNFFNIDCSTPSWYSGRLWLLRLGYYKLTRQKEKADDWIWIVDYSVQWGKEKCMVILGIVLPLQFGSSLAVLLGRLSYGGLPDVQVKMTEHL